MEENNTDKDNLLSKTSLRPLFPTKYDQTLFVNRQKELLAIQSSIKSKLNLLLLGERGSGKTSLLNHVYYDLRNDEHITPVLVNVLSTGVSDTESFLHVLITSCLREINSGGLPPALHFRLGDSLYPTETFDQINSNLENFNKIITHFKKEKKQAVFLIDGFDQNSELCYNVLSSLRETLWSVQSSFIITADIQKKNVYLKPPIDAFFDKIVEMSKFSSVDIEELFKQRIGNYPVADHIFTELAKYGSNALTDYIIFMREIINANVTTGNKTLNLESSQGFIDHVLPSNTNTKNSNVTFLNRYDHSFSPVKKEVLRYLRMHGPSSASNQEFQDYVGVSRSRLTQMLLQLTKMGVLTKSHDSQNKRILFSLANEFRNRLTYEHQ